MNNKFNFETFVARSQFLAGYFMLKGHRLIAMSPDKEDETKNVFYFTNSERLVKDYKEYGNFKYEVNKIL